MTLGLRFYKKIFFGLRFDCYVHFMFGLVAGLIFFNAARERLPLSRKFLAFAVPIFILERRTKTLALSVMATCAFADYPLSFGPVDWLFVVGSPVVRTVLRTAYVGLQKRATFQGHSTFTWDFGTSIGKPRPSHDIELRDHFAGRDALRGLWPLGVKHAIDFPKLLVAGCCPRPWKAQDCGDCIEFTQPEGADALHLSSARKQHGEVLDDEARTQLGQECPDDADTEPVRFGAFTGYGAEYVNWSEGIYWHKWFVRCGACFYSSHILQARRRGIGAAAVRQILSSLTCRDEHA